MRQIYIPTSGVAYASGIASAADLDSLAAGSFAFLEEDGTLISATVPAPTKQHVYFVVGGTSPVYDQSNLINRNDFKYSKQIYVDPVAKIMYIGDDTSAVYDMNYPAALIPGTVMTIKIYDLSKEWYDNSREHTVEYMITPSDTKATANTAMIAAINAHAGASLIVTAASSNGAGTYGISLTGVTAGIDFTAEALDIIEDADILEYKSVNKVYNGSYTTATAIVPGEGTAAQILALENEYEVEKGKINSDDMGALLWTQATKTASAVTYTTYVIMTRQEKMDASNTNGAPYLETIIIPIDSTDTTRIAAMDTILAAL